VIPRRSRCCLLLAGLASCPAAVRAENPPPIVTVYVAGSPEAVAESRDAVQELCAHSNVAVVVRDAAGADEALLATAHAAGLAEAYVDLRPGSPPRVVVVDGETRQDLERRSLPEGASLEISIETMAHVVCSAVESSLAARAGAVAPSLGPRPLERPARAVSARPSEARPLEARPESAPYQTRASLYASAVNFGDGFRAGGGAAFSVNRRFTSLRPGALLSLTGYPAADVVGASGQASLGLLGARLFGSLEWRLSPLAMAFVGLGGGADWSRISAESAPPGATLQRPSTVVDPVASGVLGVRLLLAGGVAALLAVDADVDLSRHRYVVQTPSGREPFFEPSRVRPVAWAGVSIALSGAGAAESRPSAEARR